MWDIINAIAFGLAIAIAVMLYKAVKTCREAITRYELTHHDRNKRRHGHTDDE